MKKTILLVDDEPLLREVVEQKLRKFFDQFYHASNGAEALEVLAKTPEIDLILSDIRMPVMDGTQFIKEARAKGHNQPFLFFTAYTNRETLNKVVMHGVHGFIDKGQMDGLEDAVIASLSQEDASAEELERIIKDF